VRQIAHGLIFLCATSVTAVAQGPVWRSLDVSRQLHDTSEHRIRVQYAAGKFALRPTSERVLFAMQLRYDEERMRPIHEYDSVTRRVTLGVEGDASRWKSIRGSEQGEMRLALSTAVPMDLELQLGATEARVDAGGLSLNRLRVETGAADAVLDFSAPNRSKLRRLDVQLGAAGFVITNLGNANVEYISVEGGVGSVDLDFGGAIKEDVTVDANVALGKFSLHLPNDVGVRVEVKRVLASFDHPGLSRRGNAYYSSNWDDARIKMRVRAETVFGAIEIDRGRH
jgi:hypothetical protein